MLPELFIILLLIIANGFLAGAEMAVVSARLADPSGLVLEVLDASPRLVRRVRLIRPATTQ